MPLTGITLTDGGLWEHQRRFSLRHMRDFGFGRRFTQLEDIGKEEIQDLLNILNGRREDKVIICKKNYSASSTELRHCREAVSMKLFFFMEPEDSLSYSQELARFIVLYVCSLSSICWEYFEFCLFVFMPVFLVSYFQRSTRLSMY
jgi:hypothetical protein